MLSSPQAVLCWIVLNSLESKLLLESMLNSPQAGLCWIILSSPHTVICWIVLNSLENRPLLDCAWYSGKQTFVGKYAKQSASRPLLGCAEKVLSSPHTVLCWITLNSPHRSPCWIVLNSLENRHSLDGAKESTCRPLLDCAKKSGKQTFVGLC